MSFRYSGFSVRQRDDAVPAAPKKGQKTGHELRGPQRRTVGPVVGFRHCPHVQTILPLSRPQQIERLCSTQYQRSCQAPPGGAELMNIFFAMLDGSVREG